MSLSDAERRLGLPEALHEACLRGEAILGDTLEGSALDTWFRSEKEGFAELYQVAGKDYRYPYGALDQFHAFSRLPKGRRFAHACALGAARGDELLPLLGRVDQITLVEPSSAAGSALPAEKRQLSVPRADGGLDLADASQELLLCLSALHHIPKASRTLEELGRVAAPGAWLLLREPVVSMGDWRQARRGLTPFERGLPAALLRSKLEAAGFRIRRWAPVAFPLTRRLGDAFGFSAYNVAPLVWLDALLSRLTAWNLRYHATRPWQKLRPNDIYVLAEKVA
jgi:hypothetical protein